MESFLELIKTHDMQTTDFKMEKKYCPKYTGYLQKHRKSVESIKSNERTTFEDKKIASCRLDIKRLFVGNKLIQTPSPIKGGYTELVVRKQIQSLQSKIKGILNRPRDGVYEEPPSPLRRGGGQQKEMAGYLNSSFQVRDLKAETLQRKSESLNKLLKDSSSDCHPLFNQALTQSVVLSPGIDLFPKHPFGFNSTPLDFSPSVVRKSVVISSPSRRLNELLKIKEPIAFKSPDKSKPSDFNSIKHYLMHRLS